MLWTWEALVLGNRIFEKGLAMAHKTCFLLRVFWVGWEWERIHTFRMSQFELNQDPSREQSKHSQEHYQNYTWHQTHNRERRWQ